MLRWIGRSTDVCLCGRRFLSLESSRGGRHREVRCSCGRRAAYAPAADGWSLQAVLTPEGSVPLRGFSRELLSEPGVERFWFLHPIGGATLPVHVVFSPASRRAEVKAADMKALELEDMASPSEARRIWIERHERPRGENQARALRSFRGRLRLES
jgi:hypothetical protein